MKYDEPTRAIRVAQYMAQTEDWDRAEGALLEALSAVRQRQAEAKKEAPTA